jgi:hypothetical protein
MSKLSEKGKLLAAKRCSELVIGPHRFTYCQIVLDSVLMRLKRAVKRGDEAFGEEFDFISIAGAIHYSRLMDDHNHGATTVSLVRRLALDEIPDANTAKIIREDMDNCRACTLIFIYWKCLNCIAKGKKLKTSEVQAVVKIIKDYFEKTKIAEDGERHRLKAKIGVLF